MPAVTATLVGVWNPRAVQVVVTGLTIGNAYQITGSWAGGTWPVRAGVGVAAATQVIVSDISTPINVPITYSLLATSGTAVSGAVTVTYPRRYVLQTLGGGTSVEFDQIRNGAPRELVLRSAAYRIPGRASPVVRYDIAGGETGTLVADTEDTRTATLKAMIRAGAPLLLRTDGSILDLAAVEVLSFTAASSSLIGMTRRRWNLDFEVIDDPEPDTLVASSTWADFETSYVGITWATFQTEWTGQTWLDFQVHDWATRAAS